MLSLLLILVECVGILLAQNTFTCPADWPSSSGVCYRFVMYPLETYLDAISRCQEDGASLLSIESYAEHSFINNWLTQNDLNRYDWFTSGAVDTSSPGKFKWEGTETRIDGDEYWITPQDRNRQGNNIIYRFEESIGGYGWTRAMATDSLDLAYICEIPENESWRIKKEVRDFTYGTIYTDPNLVPKGPMFFRQPIDTEVIGKTTLLWFECLASGLPSPSYKWMRQKNETTELITFMTDSRYTLTSGKLSITNPTEALDAGRYWCSAENIFGKILSSVALLSFAYLGEFSNVDTQAVSAVEYQGKVIVCPDIPHRSNAGIHYRWERSRKQIQKELNEHIFISQDGKLYFSEITGPDNGTYNCMAALILPGGKQNYEGSTQSAGGVSKTITLSVIGSPSTNFDAKIQDSFIQVFPRQPLVGQKLRLECLAYGTSPLVYSWALPIAKDERVSFLDFNRVVEITDVRLEDAGVYTCFCTSRKTGNTDNKQFTLRIEAKPFFTLPLSHQHVDEGNQLTWRCEARGIPQPVYKWYKNGEALETQQDGSIVVNRNSITIPMLDAKKHDGMYQCSANNSYGVTMSSAQLRVLSFKPTFIKSPLPSTMMGTIQGNATIVCDPEAAPYPSYRWYRNNANLNVGTGDSTSRIRMLANGNLLMTKLGAGDAGLYTCEVENKHGKARSTTRLEILSGTRIVQRPVPEEVQVNNTAFIPCRASFNTKLDLIYSWMLNGRLLDLEMDSHYRAGDTITGGLYVRNAQFRHQGSYSCVARTTIDRDIWSAYLTVLGPPGPPAGVFLDQKDSTLPRRSVRLKWTDGDDHGSSIQFYLIEGQTNYSKEWIALKVNLQRRETALPADPEKRSTVIENLKPGVSYKFRVIATNVYGIGEPSYATEWKTIPGDKPIKAVSFVGGGGGKVGNLRMYWEPLAPEDRNNGDGFGYLVEWRLKPQPQQGEPRWEKERVYGNQNNYTALVGSANFYMPYEVKVTAFNVNGTSDVSTTGIVYSAEDLPVGTPEAVYAKPYNSTALTVHWKPVKDDRETMKGKLLGYKVNYWNRYTETELQSIQAIFGEGQRDKAVIIGLQNNTWYFVSVIAYNSAGNGPKSEKYPQQTDRLPPQLYPTEVHVHSNGAESVKVTFRGVSSQAGEDPLRGYKIRYWESSDNIRQAEDIDVDKANYGYIYGLKKGIVYKLRVLAYSEGGDGKLSSPSTLFTLEGGQIPWDPATTEIMAAAPKLSSLSMLTLLICSILTWLYLLK